jgi:hypothetical protein
METGVEFFGGWSNRGLPVIQLAVGPGPQAIHQPCHYEQDIEFFHRIHDVIVSEFGIEWIGGGHCHHTLGLPGPSQGDVQQVMGVTRRNGLDRWCEIITTFADTDRNPRMDEAVAKIPRVPSRPPQVMVNAYLYTDPQNGESIQVPLRILPGVSPIRKAILESGILSPADIGEYASCFPWRKILYESFGSQTDYGDPAEEVLEVIAAQCQELSEESQCGITLSMLQDSVTVTLPLPNAGVVCVEYDRKPPYEIIGVRVRSRSDETSDPSVTDLLDKRRVTTLSQIYRLLACPDGSEAGYRRSWYRMKAVFEAATHAANACIGRIRRKT